MTDTIRVGDRVKIHLDSRFGENEGWYEGTVFKIEPYSEHRRFYWVQLDDEARKQLGVKEISVFNPKHISKIRSGKNLPAF